MQNTANVIRISVWSSDVCSTVLLWVLDQLEGNLDLPQPQFLAIIEDDVAAQLAEQRHLHPRIGRGVDVLGGPARQRARRVVILERPARPADPRRVGPALGRLAHELRGQAIGAGEAEAIGAVKSPHSSRAHLPLATRNLPAPPAPGKADPKFVGTR